MSQPILVTGGTGTLGTHVVRLLLDAGCPVRVLSRKQHDGASPSIEFMVGDLTTGDGVDATVAGVETIIHCAGAAKDDDVKAASLVGAAARAGRPHIVFISVVGADRVPMASAIDRALFGYFGSKLAAEKVIAASGLPFTTLRATQFHDIILLAARALTKSPVVPAMGGFRFQPVDSAEVAARLVELALGKPQGLVDDFGGPAIYDMAELLRSYLSAAGKRRPILKVGIPGQAARAVRAGATLAAGHAVGRRSWEDFLAASTSSPGSAAH
jgi:uncharacterized protein YbjT (DUF2867 family)